MIQDVFIEFGVDIISHKCFVYHSLEIKLKNDQYLIFEIAIFQITTNFYRLTECFAVLFSQNTSSHNCKKRLYFWNFYHISNRILCVRNTSLSLFRWVSPRGTEQKSFSQIVSDNSSDSDFWNLTVLLTCDHRHFDVRSKQLWRQLCFRPFSLFEIFRLSRSDIKSLPAEWKLTVSPKHRRTRRNRLSVCIIFSIWNFSIARFLT